MVTCALLLGFQLALLLRQPPWIGPVTDWLRAALSWPELAIVVGVSLWLSRRHRPEALAWWLFSGGALCYAIARTWWMLDDALIHDHGVPFPSFPDLFFVLQYPFYFLAVILIPFGGVLWPPAAGAPGRPALDGGSDRRLLGSPPRAAVHSDQVSRPWPRRSAWATRSPISFCSSPSC